MSDKGLWTMHRRQHELPARRHARRGPVRSGPPRPPQGDGRPGLAVTDGQARLLQTGGHAMTPRRVKRDESLIGFLFLILFWLAQK